MKPALLIAAAAALTVALPAAAQDHSQHGAPQPAAQKPAVQAPPARAKPRVKPRPTRRAPAQTAPKPQTPAAADPHAGHDMQGQQSPSATEAPDPHAGHNMSGEQAPPTAEAPDSHAGHYMAAGDADMQHGAAGTALPAGNAPAPVPPTDHYADRIFPPDEMARARARMTREHGGGTASQLIFNVAEVQVRDGRNGYRWDGEFWFGGDINRLTLKSEGEGSFGEPIEGGEVQALYSRALDPYWNLQAGVRQDFGRGPSRSYVTLGVEGLAPYWFEVEGAVFLSDKGDLFGRAEAHYDQRITQRLILQPRVELNLSAQDVPESRLGAGVSNVELGLRLRYEITREFAPYVGISYDRKVGDTARYARIDGEDVGEASMVVGVRFWF